MKCSWAKLHFPILFPFFRWKSLHCTCAFVHGQWNNPQIMPLTVFTLTFSHFSFLIPFFVTLPTKGTFPRGNFNNFLILFATANRGLVQSMLFSPNLRVHFPRASQTLRHNLQRKNKPMASAIGRNACCAIELSVVLRTEKSRAQEKWQKFFQILSLNNFIIWFGVISSPKRINIFAISLVGQLWDTSPQSQFSFTFFCYFFFNSNSVRGGSWHTFALLNTRFGRSELYTYLCGCLRTTLYRHQFSCAVVVVFCVTSIAACERRLRCMNIN